MEKKEVMEEIIANAQAMSVEEYKILYESIAEDNEINVINEEYRIKICDGGNAFLEKGNFDYSPQHPIVIEKTNKAYQADTNIYALVA